MCFLNTKLWLLKRIKNQLYLFLPGIDLSQTGAKANIQ